MPSPITTVRLPDLLEGWPFERKINPHSEEVAAESTQWIEAHEPFDERYLAVFRKCNFGLIASLAYPNASRDILRTGCDLMNAFFVFDDISDGQCSADVRKGADIIMDALRNPYDPRPQGESILGDVFQTFWSRALIYSSRSAAHRFINHFQDYVDAVVEQAIDREHNRIRSVEDYLTLRRHTIGCLPSFNVLQMNMDLPDFVVTHPQVLNLVTIATDMIILANDLYSYNIEQYRGDEAHNMSRRLYMVAVIMKSHDLNVQDAVDHIGEQYRQLRDRFLTDRETLPSWSEDVNRELKEYIEGLGNWVTANVEWSFESERYFGKDGPEIRQHRNLVLLSQEFRC
ncbi:terpenoid synthase [Sistotremastrum suecicum HHB10207 ss-3]|uniref:Terpene synthase n=1 Tax=Sistotremastrum suecicum HHB10207 ss-3 TaxID=1314776 RepID=A0A165Z3T2_9AGAM|nr:terpenoid synthase [Sistotremastrum suecicum HHB10207 ss-3]